MFEILCKTITVGSFANILPLLMTDVHPDWDFWYVEQLGDYESMHTGVPDKLSISRQIN